MSVRDIVQAAAGVGGGANPYIEDVFSTYLYTGNGSTQTITNGIDLDGEGGLVWIKSRSVGSGAHYWVDTVRGATKTINSDNTVAEFTAATGVTAFSSSGFSIGSNGNINQSGSTNASWTFRKAPKFFDVVTYTGDGTGTRSISHALDAVPGCVIVKRTDAAASWFVYHRSSFASGFDPEDCILNLNNTNAVTDNASYWGGVAPTSTNFSVGSALNTNGATYVAYLFAHDAGGFGDDGLQNVISCGSAIFSAGQEVNLGWEPQWLLVKNISSAQDWYIIDNIRGWLANGNAAWLSPNTTAAEVGTALTTNFGVDLTSTGFKSNAGSGITFIYIAIRRGPMKTPTSGTEVYQPKSTTSIANVGSTTGTLFSTPFVADMLLQKINPGSTGDWYNGTRSIGPNYLITNKTDGQATSAAAVYDSNRGVWGYNSSYSVWAYKRAPGFFDVCCYTGDNSSPSFNHNLGVTPELIIIKNRTNTLNWIVFGSVLGGAESRDNYMFLNTTDVMTVFDNYRDANDTSTTFGVRSGNGFSSTAGYTYVAYLFATLAGVSKVGSYAGTGAAQDIDCGFSNGARFVLIKGIDVGADDWYFFDSVLGITSGNDTFYRLNTTSNTSSVNYINPLPAGFSMAGAGLNISGRNYIFLAIA